MASQARTHEACLRSAVAGIGLYADRLPPRDPLIAVLTDAISELNMTPGTLTDEQQARALQRILARRGLVICAADDLKTRSKEG